MEAKIYLKYLMMLSFMLHFPARAQSGGESAYARLLKTQAEYKTAIMTADSGQISEMCYLLGKRYIAIGHYSKAQQWLLKSLHIREPQGASEGIGKIYLRLSEIQVVLDNLPAARQYARLAHSNFKQSKSQKGLAGSYRALGDLYRMNFAANRGVVGSLDSAIHCYKSSQTISAITNDSLDLAVTFQSLGITYDLKKDFVTSMYYYEQAFKIFEKKKLLNNITELATKITLDLLLRHQTSEAKKWLDKIEPANDGRNAHLGIQESLLGAKSLYYEQINELEKSLFYQRQLLDIKTKNYEQERLQAMSNIGLAHENELNLASLAAHKKESVLQKRNMVVQKRFTYTLFALFVGAGIACFLFFLLFVKYRKLSRENAILVKEQNHRTKNNLQSISDLLSLQLYQLSDPGAVEAMEESLMRVQAMTLAHRSLYSGEELVFIDLQKYIPDLIEMVFRSYDQKLVKVYYNIDEVLLHCDKAVSLGLIVNELATNACKYAFKQNPFPELRISCRIRNGQIFFDFCDNGPGLPLQKRKKGFGIDLIKILSDRLKAQSDYVMQDGCRFSLSFQAEGELILSGSREKLRV